MSDRHGEAFQRTFGQNQMSIGLFFPIEAFRGPRPSMEDQVDLAIKAEALGYSALWARDVPLDDPSFGDLGQLYDPFVWLGVIASHTHSIALATGSVILPLHHPIDLAKQAASVDQLSKGRLILGVASGDRPIEYPAYGRDRAQRSELFRDALGYVDALLHDPQPRYKSVHFGELVAGDLVPKPYQSRLPLLATGSSGQSLQWLANTMDGWITYPRPPRMQTMAVSEWKDAQNEKLLRFKPIVQSLYIDLDSDPSTNPIPIHLGYRLGVRRLKALIAEYSAAGIDHIAVNLKQSSVPAADAIEIVADALFE